VDAHIDDAIAYVNDSTMGLGATLRSSDPALIKRCFEEAKVGTVWINDPLTRQLSRAFGGRSSPAVDGSSVRRAWRRSRRPSTCTGTSAAT
jgi:acyl-CoA reductase-like NAD-dependent aldehyde dehydrogenase